MKTVPGKIKKTLYLSAMFLCCAFVCAAQKTAGMEKSKKRPNIIFLLADDLGWGDLSCYGNTKITTANLDRLAASGTLFSQYYASASVCSPSRAALLTGRYPARDSIHGHFANHERNGARGMPDFLNPSLLTLPGLLQQNGYATAHFGKWHLGAGPQAPDLDRYGFDVYKMGGFNSDEVWEVGDTSTQMDISSPAARPMSSARVADCVIDFIKTKQEKPFYINAWFLDVHATLNPSKEQTDAVKHLGITGKVPFVSPAQIYYGTLLEMDKQIGRIVNALKEAGLLDNTILIFSSDNGPEDINVINSSHSGVGSAGPFRGRKRSLYEGGTRLPFIVAWPGHIAAGKTDNTSVLAGVDLLPSVSRLAGVTLPSSFLQDGDGEDRSSCWLGETTAREKPLFWEWRANMPGHLFHKSPTLCIREGKWKLLMNEDKSRMELYDMENDRIEWANVAEKNPAIVQRLSAALLKWKATLPASPVDVNAGKINYPWPRNTKTKD